MRTLFRRALTWPEVWLPLIAAAILFGGIMTLVERANRGAAAEEVARALQRQMQVVVEQNRKSVEAEHHLKSELGQVKGELRAVKEAVGDSP